MKQVAIEIPEYSTEKGIQMSWENGFTIDVRIDKDVVIIRANEAGLVSLARQLLTLAQPKISHGHHLHYDQSNSLEDGSCDIIIEKF